MTIFFWLITLMLFFATFLTLALYAVSQPGFRENFLIFINGFKNALNNGFNVDAPPQKVTVYKWIPMEDACDESFERADMPAKDIIDWMEAGLPGTPEMMRKCGNPDCRCQLMAVRRARKTNPQPPL